jgi:hypothetical protein
MVIGAPCLRRGVSVGLYGFRGSQSLLGCPIERMIVVGHTSPRRRYGAARERHWAHESDTPIFPFWILG